MGPNEKEKTDGERFEEQIDDIYTTTEEDEEEQGKEKEEDE